MTLDGWTLKAPEAPSGILSFELAKAVETSREIRCAWHWKGVTGVARRNLALDYLFIPAYVGTLWLACLGASRWLSDRNLAGASLAIHLGRLQWVAGGFDALENTALLILLGERVEGSLAFWAAILATLKFALILGGLAIIIWAAFTRWALGIEPGVT